MKGYIANIEKISRENENFREVLYTTKNMQLVVMTLRQGEEIGEEVHPLDQFISCISGTGQAVLNDVVHEIGQGSVVVVPAGAKHNIINTSPEASLKLYTVYAPPDHMDGIIHKTKAEAEAGEEPFDGKTTE